MLARCREHAPESRAWTIDLADLDGARRVRDAGGRRARRHRRAREQRRHPEAQAGADAHARDRRRRDADQLLLAGAPHARAARRDHRARRAASCTCRRSRPGSRRRPRPRTRRRRPRSRRGPSACRSTSATPRSGSTCVYPGVIDTELFHLPDNDPAPHDRRRDAARRRDRRARAHRDRDRPLRGLASPTGSTASTRTSPRTWPASSTAPSPSSDPNPPDAKPPSRTRGKRGSGGEADGLGLEVLLETGDAVLAALAALLVAAEGRVGAEPLAAVDRDRAGADPAGDAERAVERAAR